MKLAVSNMAWSAEENAGAAQLLHAYGATGIELVPTVLWGEWPRALAAVPADIPPPLQGFSRPAMQSLLFNLPDHALFRDAEAETRLVEHLLKVIALAKRLSVGVLVFGSPRQRVRGATSMTEAVKHFAHFAARVAPAAADPGVKLALEANPEAYGCDFITSTPELIELFERVRQPGIGLHFDTGTAIINGEDLAGLIRAVGSSLNHFHISQPQLEGFSAMSDTHAACTEALRAMSYSHWVSIEMRRGERGLVDLETAVAATTEVYGFT